MPHNTHGREAGSQPGSFSATPAPSTVDRISATRPGSLKRMPPRKFVRFSREAPGQRGRADADRTARSPSTEAQLQSVSARAYLAAHDVGNLLSATLMLLSTQRVPEQTTAIEMNLSEAVSSVEHALATTRRLLDLLWEKSELESGHS